MNVEKINELVVGAQVKEEEQPAAPNPTENLDNKGGGNPVENQQEQPEEPGGGPGTAAATNAPEPEQKDRLKELMDELGVSSVEELKALKEKATKKEPTPEEKEQEEAVARKNFELFAVRERLLTTQDFITHANITAANDYDLVFNDYLKEWKDENADAIKENGATTEDDIRALAKIDFETEFKLNAASEKSKERGLAKLAAEAERLRVPAKSKYEQAFERFKEEQEIRTNFPLFSSKTEEIVKGIVGNEIEWHKGKDGDDEFSIKLDITEAQRTEILGYLNDKLNTSQNYLLFKQGKVDEIKEMAEALAEAKISRMFRAQASEKIAQAYESIGIKKGSIGAVNSFEMNKVVPSENAAGMTEKEKVLASLKEK